MSEQSKSGDNFNEKIEKMVQCNILLLLHKKNPVGDEIVLNDKIENLYEKLLGIKFSKKQPINLCIEDIPGSKIKSIHQQFATEISKELGINIVMNPGKEYKLQQNDLVVCEASEYNVISWTGTPLSLNDYKTNQSKIDTLNNILNNAEKTAGVLVIATNFTDPSMISIIANSLKENVNISLLNFDKKEPEMFIKTRFLFVENENRMKIAPPDEALMKALKMRCEMRYQTFSLQPEKINKP